MFLLSQTSGVPHKTYRFCRFFLSRYLSSSLHSYSQAPRKVLSSSSQATRSCIARSKRDGTRAETRFGLSAKRRSPFKPAGVSVLSTTGSRGVRIRGQRLYRPCSEVQWKAAGYSLHSNLSPSLPLPCVTVCHQVPNAL